MPTRCTMAAGVRLPPVLVALVGSVFITACGGGGMGGANAVGPSFVSTPGTVAAEGVTYTYQIETSPASVTLALVTAPSGASLSGNTLTWIPSAAESRAPNQFSVTAANAAATMTQSWTVTPSGTITGSWIETHWTSTGPIQVPFKWATGLPPTAFVLQPDASFQTVRGSGNADGTFSIPNVPAGYYWFAPTPVVRYWTSSSTIDLGIDFNGGLPPGTTAPASTTTFDFNLSGLDPLQVGDEVAFLPDDPLVLQTVFSASSPADAITLSVGTAINSNIDFSQIRSGFLLQYEPVPAAELSISALGAEATLSNLTLNNGVVNTIPATLAHSPRTAFDLNVKGTGWTSLFSNAAPTQVSFEGSDLSLIAEPYLNGAQFVPSFGVGIPLLTNPQELAPGFCAVPGPNPSELVPGPCQPPITTDQDFGLIQYGDPFPSAWPRVFRFSQTASVQLPLQGSTSTFPFALTDSESTVVPSSRISPLIAQVQNPTINGSSLFAAATVPAAGITLNWTAPGGTTPTGYKIALLVEGATPLNGSPTYLPAGTFYTAKTSVPLPPLQAGKTYVFVITAILDGAANFETRPNHSALPTASASIVSAPITMNP